MVGKKETKSPFDGTQGKKLILEQYLARSLAGKRRIIGRASLPGGRGVWECRGH